MQQKVLNNRYELEQKIGEGGMARVYRGRDLRLNRRVAVKVLHSHYANDRDFLDRFQHEAQAAAILSHPNVVDVYDVGQDGDIHYIVMEYVEGQDLKRLINREAPLSVERAVAIAEAVALGLAAAHRVGLVHRDIKPQNIMVAPDGHVRIADFGIAKSHLSTAMTETGVTFGTADYIAPEQAQGQQATPRSDIYALGVVLYEMLTARLPFTADNAIGVAMQHINANPTPLHHFNPHVPAQLEALVLRAMAKDPSQRPATAQEFARLLHNYQTLAVQDTIASSAVRPGQQQSRPLSSSRSATGTTAARAIPPPPSRATRNKAPQQQGVGCGGFVLGFVLLAGVLGIVLLVTTGAFDTLFAASASPFVRPSAVVAIAPSSTPHPTAAATIPATVTPSTTPTATVTPTPLPLVVVPNVGGKSEADARQQLSDLKLLPVLGGQSNDDNIPEGSVISQQIQPGTQLAEGQLVTYTVSLGPELISVPDFVRAGVDFAATRSQQLGLQIQVVEEQSSAQIDQGFIISQTPKAQARVTRGSTIQLVVSRGDKVLVPNVKGLSEADARTLIEQTDGLRFSYSDFQGRDRLGALYDQIPPGVVVSSSPAEGSWVDRNTPVTLGVRAP